jgi:hypothetical protein
MEHKRNKAAKRKVIGPLRTPHKPTFTFKDKKAYTRKRKHKDRNNE